MEHVDVIIIGGGTAGSNSARAALKAGAEKVVMVHKPELLNTCVEEGCMPSKSVLAGAHQGENMETVEHIRNAHIERLTKALTEGFQNSNFQVVQGEAKFISNQTVEVKTEAETKTYKTKGIVIATGSHSFVPPIPGLDSLGDKMWVSDDVVSRRAQIKETPKRVLTIGAGPIGLELSTFLHDMGSEVKVLQKGPVLGPYDIEFGEERLRASQDQSSFPIDNTVELVSVRNLGDELEATLKNDEETFTENYDKILIATGRRPNTADLGLEEVGVTFDERGKIIHDEQMKTSVDNIYVAGDVVGHHQILHFAAEMGKVAGFNAFSEKERKQMDYDRHMLAVSFDQFPSAMIGLTEKEATSRGIEVVTSTKYFNSIGLGILKRQEYGLWKLVADKSTGQIIGSQILGPDSAGELIQILVPIIANKNTYGEVLDMTWYHPTYGEIILSLARDMCQREGRFCPGYN